MMNGESMIDFHTLVNADNDTLCEMSLKYSTGDGVDLDYVIAHVLLNIAAIRGSKDAVAHRKAISEEMDSDEIAKAQKIAREVITITRITH
jgi:TPR repeat protein